MSVLVSDLINLLDDNISDSSTNVVSNNQRFRALSESIKSGLYLESAFNFATQTFKLNFFDTINYYNITSDVPDFLYAVDLRREDENDNTPSAKKKSMRELASEIAEGSTEKSFSVEIRDLKRYLGINYPVKHSKVGIHSGDSLTSNGTWSVDSTNSDATNLTLDTVEFQEGSGSLNFDVDVSQSANNKATIRNSDMTAKDLTDHENLSSFIFDIYIPSVTNFSSITFYIGDSLTTYWSATVTTDAFGASFVNEWNTVKIAWSDMTKTGFPDITDIDTVIVDYNYTASQGDDTDFRLDNIRLVRPERLKLFYTTAYVGQDTSGTDITDFSATTDVPRFSGLTDDFKFYVGHKAAEIIARGILRDIDLASLQGRYAREELNKLKNKFPEVKLKITRNFKANTKNWKN